MITVVGASEKKQQVTGTNAHYDKGCHFCFKGNDAVLIPLL